MRVKCRVNLNYESCLKKDGIYEVIRELPNEEEMDRPYYVLLGENGIKVTAHQSRFEIIND